MSVASDRPKRGAATKARDLISRIASGENVNVARERDAVSSSSATTTKKRQTEAQKLQPGAVVPAKKKSKSSSEKSNTLALLPIWVAAEILKFLDLASVLAVTEVSHGVRAVFRTPASAAILLPLVLRSTCANHRIDLAHDTADEAWTALKFATRFAWTPSSDEASDDSGCDFGEDNNSPCVAANLPAGFKLERFHRGRCCKAMLHATPAQRRTALIAELAHVNEKLRSDSNLCNGFISGTLRDRSLCEVAAVMKCTRYLFSISHVAYSHNHDLLNSAMSRAKFAHNLDWVAAANSAISDGNWEVYSDESDGYGYGGGYGGGRGECWNCGRYGHFARDCWQ